MTLKNQSGLKPTLDALVKSADIKVSFMGDYDQLNNLFDYMSILVSQMRHYALM